MSALVACSSPQGGTAPSPTNPAVSVPSAPPTRPRLPNLDARDRDGDRIDDALEAGTDDAERLVVEVILTKPTERSQLDTFVRNGGQVRHVFSKVSYGWTGTILRSSLVLLRSELGAPLHFIAASRRLVLQLDEATRTGRARPIWSPGFAGYAAGIAGDPQTTIAVIDTGVDGTHPDLALRSAGFQDYSADDATQPRDAQGHGTHVASIAVGSGAAFGVGPGTLRYTNSGDLSGSDPGVFLPGPIHTPSYLAGEATLQVSSDAVWRGGAAASLFLAQASDAVDAWSQFGLVTGTSPESILNASTADSSARYSDSLAQTQAANIGAFSVANRVASYPGVGDGFDAFRGVAPNCRWFDAKVFTDQGVGSSTNVAEALDDLVVASVAKNIQIINLSLSSDGGVDEALRAKVNTVVENGIVVVVAGGNGGPATEVPDPGRAGEAITVGATNDLNELTTYTSVGFAAPSASEDTKPDVLAPGGSSYRSLILAADSNTTDAETRDFPDLAPDDYTGMQGTSMAAAFVSGSAALLIDGWQRAGNPWLSNGNAGPLLIKALLLASATETNTAREQGLGADPALGRAAAPKDRFEGFGIVNPDAAVEAVSSALSASLSGSVSAQAPARLEWEPRAWGRHVLLQQTDTLVLKLTVPSTADFDLYVYAGQPDENGNPILRASSTNAGAGASELLSFVATSSETAYVFVKRVAGFGTFSLSAAHRGSCGNGVVDNGEECDPTSTADAACCDATCRNVVVDARCDEADRCQTGGRCHAGKCQGQTAVLCPGAAACRLAGICDSATGRCSSPAASDGSPCPQGACQAGACVTDTAPASDAGSADAFSTDTGSAGAGGIDPGSIASDDAGSDDAGSVVAGSADAGSRGAASSAGMSNLCGCSAAGAATRPSALWLTELLALFVLGRRKTRVGRSPRRSALNELRDCGPH